MTAAVVALTDRIRAALDDRQGALNERAAVAYAGRFGWAVLPLHSAEDGRCSCGRPDCPSPGKHPRTKNGLRDATTDEARIRRWWTEWPTANVGIATGKASGFDVLDVDPRQGGDDTLAELVAEYELLPRTAEQLTGGGGRHVLFRHHPGLRNSAGKLSGLDVRSTGGYVVVAPSTHASGRSYSWELSARPGEVPVAPWPDWLLEALQGAPTRPALPEEGQIPEGGRNAHLTSLAGSMRRRGMSPSAILAALREENKLRCAPQLAEGEVAAIARSVGRYPPAATGGAEGQQDDPHRAAPDLREEPAPAAGPEPRRKLVLTPASSITPKPVRWLWEDDDAGRVPAGEITLTPGPAGVGKSTFHVWLVARLTRGQLPGVHYGTPRACLICATEDSWAQTLIPRLIAAGADLDLIYRVDVVEAGEGVRLTLPEDINALAEEIRQHDVVMSSLDPLMTLVSPDLDTHKDAEVRRALEPLKRLAETTNCVILGNAHYNKGLSSDPMARITGSAAFGQVVRAVLAFARDPDGGKCVISQVKNSLGRLDLPSLAYRIESAEVPTDEGPADVGRLVFCGTSARSVQDILGDHDDDEARQAGSEAEDLIRATCVEEVRALDVIAQAGAEGVAKRTLQRAARRLCEWRREGFGPGSVVWWKLRTDATDANRCHRRPSQSKAPMAPMSPDASEEGEL